VQLLVLFRELELLLPDEGLLLGLPGLARQLLLGAALQDLLPGLLLPLALQLVALQLRLVLKLRHGRRLDQLLLDLRQTLAGQAGRRGSVRPCLRAFGAAHSPRELPHAGVPPVRGALLQRAVALAAGLLLGLGRGARQGGV
jgi:hypothetical protein